MEQKIVKDEIQKSNTLKEQILKVKQKYPTLGMKKIAKFLKISSASVWYHLTPNARKIRRKQNINYEKRAPLCQKITGFNERTKNKSPKDKKVKQKELIKKIGSNPICYLSGRSIDLFDTNNYHLDHVTPSSKGGNNSLNNCNIACKEANLAKNDLTAKDFIKLCKDVLKHNGYMVKKAR